LNWLPDCRYDDRFDGMESVFRFVKHFGMMDKMPARKKAGTMKMQM